MSSARERRCSIIRRLCPRGSRPPDRAAGPRSRHSTPPGSSTSSRACGRIPASRSATATGWIGSPALGDHQRRDRDPAQRLDAVGQRHLVRHARAGRSATGVPARSSAWRRAHSRTAGRSCTAAGCQATSIRASPSTSRRSTRSAMLGAVLGRAAAVQGRGQHEDQPVEPVRRGRRPATAARASPCSARGPGSRRRGRRRGAARRRARRRSRARPGRVGRRRVRP